MTKIHSLEFYKKIQELPATKWAHYQALHEKDYFLCFYRFLVGQKLGIWLWERPKEEL